MIAVELTATFLDGRTEVARPGPIDEVMFERRFGVPITIFGDNPRAEWVYFLAWNPLRRAGKASDDFDTFLEQLETIDVKVTPAVPTEPVPPTGA